MKAVVSDATTLIILAKASSTGILEKIFSQVIIPETVFAEITAKNDHNPQLWAEPFFKIESGTSLPAYKALTAFLDPGESEALALAQSRNLPALVDEKKGRTVAAGMNIKVIGLVGVLLALHRKGMLGRTELKELILKFQDLGFRLSPMLLEDFLRALEPPSAP